MTRWAYNRSINCTTPTPSIIQQLHYRGEPPPPAPEVCPLPPPSHKPRPHHHAQEQQPAVLQSGKVNKSLVINPRKTTSSWKTQSVDNLIFWKIWNLGNNQFIRSTKPISSEQRSSQDQQQSNNEKSQEVIHRKTCPNLRTILHRSIIEYQEVHQYG